MQQRIEEKVLCVDVEMMDESRTRKEMKADQGVMYSEEEMDDFNARRKEMFKLNCGKAWPADSDDDSGDEYSDSSTSDD